MLDEKLQVKLNKIDNEISDIKKQILTLVTPQEYEKVYFLFCQMFSLKHYKRSTIGRKNC